MLDLRAGFEFSSYKNRPESFTIILMSESQETPDQPKADTAHPDWFREPNARELLVGIGLFLGFGIFFILSFILGKDWGFRWLFLIFGIISTVRSMWYVLCFVRMRFRKK